MKEYVVRELKEGRLRFAAEDPDAPENFPRVLTLWRCNLLGSSSKGHEFFLKHLLGVPDAAIRTDESPEDLRPEEVTWRDPPEGKLHLLTTIDFRKNGSSLYSDIVLPAATWYEKCDISSTDLHPFVHPFNPAISPPWEAKSDWDIFNYVAEVFSRLAKTHLGVRKDLVAAPLLHDTPEELAQPTVLDWKKGECEPIPGKTMPKLVEIERDYGAVAEKMMAIDPAVENVGIGARNTIEGETLRHIVGSRGSIGFLVRAWLATRPATEDAPVAAVFRHVEDLSDTVLNLYQRGTPLWYLVFLNSAMARARGLEKGHVLFGAYPEERAARVEPALRKAVESHRGRVLPREEAGLIWDQRFFPARSSGPVPTPGRAFIQGAHLGPTLMKLERKLARGDPGDGIPVGRGVASGFRSGQERRRSRGPHGRRRSSWYS